MFKIIKIQSICDRCDKIYETGHEKFKIKNRGWFHDATITLCPKCEKELEEWLIYKKKKEDK